MWKRLKQKWKDKKGFGSIEIVISSMIVLMMIAGLIDMIQITQRFDTTSQATDYVSRIVQKQGGVQVSRIPNYQGQYTTTKTLYDNVEDMMNSNGISDDDWSLTLQLENGSKYTISPKSTVPLVDFGHRIRITLSVNYRWNMLGSMFPGDLEGTRQSTKEILSGYQIRDNSVMDNSLDVR